MDAIWGDKFPKWARSQMTNAWSFLEQLDVVWFLTAVYLVVSLVGCSSLLSNRVILKEWNTTIRYNLWGAPRQQSTALESARWLSPAKCRVMMLLDARSSKLVLHLRSDAWASEASKASGRSSETFQPQAVYLEHLYFLYKSRFLDFF